MWITRGIKGDIYLDAFETIFWKSKKSPIPNQENLYKSLEESVLWGLFRKLLWDPRVKWILFLLQK